MEVITMKKFKKLLSILMAATLVCGLSAAPVFASEEGNQAETPTTTTTTPDTTSSDKTTPTKGKYGDGTNAVTEIPFVKIMEAAAGTNVTADKFTFTLKPLEGASGKNGELEIKEGILPKDQESISTTIETLSTDVTTALSNYSTEGKVYESKFDLTGIPFPTTGHAIYRYVAEEEKIEDEKTLTHVTQKGETYIVDLYVENGKVIYAQAKNKTTQNKEPIVFRNELHYTSITIEKVLDGDFLSDTDKNKDFTFQIKIPEGGDEITLTKGQVMDAYKVKTDSTESKIGTITVAGSKITTTTGWETSDWSTFTLKAGEKLVIKNVPMGMIYWVKEVTDSTTEETSTTADGQSKTEKFAYEISFATVAGTSTLPSTATYASGIASDNGVRTAKQTSLAGGNIVSIKNTKEKIDTGIVLDVMPYVVVVLIAVAGALLLFSRKKRNLH
jgi:hypothetical protein